MRTRSILVRVIGVTVERGAILRLVHRSGKWARTPLLDFYDLRLVCYDLFVPIPSNFNKNLEHGISTERGKGRPD